MVASGYNPTMTRRVISHIVVFLIGVGIAVYFGRGLPEDALLGFIAGAVGIVALLGLIWLKA